MSSLTWDELTCGSRSWKQFENAVEKTEQPSFDKPHDVDDEDYSKR